MKNTLAFFGIAAIFFSTTANAIDCPSGKELRGVLRRFAIRADIAQYLTSGEKTGTLETNLPDDEKIITVSEDTNNTGTTCTYFINTVKAFTLTFTNANK